MLAREVVAAEGHVRVSDGVAHLGPWWSLIRFYSGIP
jgi:hypothetical protein